MLDFFTIYTIKSLDDIEKNQFVNELIKNKFETINVGKLKTFRHISDYLSKLLNLNTLSIKLTFRDIADRM